MDYSAEVLNALLDDLQALASRPAVKARLEVLRSMPGKGINLFPHAFVCTAALPYTAGKVDPEGAEIFEPFFARFKQHWDQLPGEERQSPPDHQQSRSMSG